jgi:DNA-binding beta-propeller fold protein YncE
MATIADPGHAESVCRALWASSQAGGGDASIVSPTATFRVHSEVVAAASPYFAAMFSSPMVEGRARVVALEGGESARTVQHVLRFAYTGQLEAPASELMPVAMLADRWLMHRLAEHCLVALSRRLEPLHGPGDMGAAEHLARVPALAGFARDLIAASLALRVERPCERLHPKDLGPVGLEWVVHTSPLPRRLFAGPEDLHAFVSTWFAANPQAKDKQDQLLAQCASPRFFGLQGGGPPPVLATSLSLIPNSATSMAIAHDGGMLTASMHGSVFAVSPEGEVVQWFVEDAHHLHVAEGARGEVILLDRRNCIVVVFTRDGDEVRRWGGRGEGDGEFIFPHAILASADGSVVVLDTGNDRVQVFTREGVFLHSWPCGPVPQGNFALDAEGHLAVVGGASEAVQIFDCDGRLESTWGAKGQAPGELCSPTDVAFDPYGRLVVADTGNHRVQVFSLEGGFVSTFGDEASLPRPVGVVVDGEGLLLVRCSRGLVRLLINEGGRITAD